MGSSKLRSKIFDRVRKKWVKATPEENIRQNLIEEMVEKLGYPLSLLAVERELAQLPHLQLTHLSEIPKRRADVVVFAKEIHPAYPSKSNSSGCLGIFPLLMVECKAVSLTPKFAAQVVGYNHSVQARFLALANGERILTGHFDHESGLFRFESGLPTYSALIERCSAATF